MEVACRLALEGEVSSRRGQGSPGTGDRVGRSEEDQGGTARVREDAAGAGLLQTPPRKAVRPEVGRALFVPPPFPDLSPEKTPVQDRGVASQLEAMRIRMEKAEAKQREMDRAHEEKVRELERQMAQQDLETRSHGGGSDLGSQSEAMTKALQDGIQAGLEKGMVQQGKVLGEAIQALKTKQSSTIRVNTTIACPKLND